MAVDVCASAPCANSGVCESVPDVALGGGAGYRCVCATGFSGRLCTVGEHVFPHVNNPFLGNHARPFAELALWKPIEDVTKPYPLVDAFVPPKGGTPLLHSVLSLHPHT